TTENAPAITSVTAGGTSVSNGGVTRFNTIVISGTSDVENGRGQAYITIKDFSSVVVTIPNLIAGTNGAWSYTVPGNVGDGSHSYTETATDIADITSSASAAFTFTIDTSAPNAPQTPILDSADNPNSDGNTPNRAPHFHGNAGSAEPGAIIKVYDDGNPNPI